MMPRAYRIKAGMYRVGNFRIEDWSDGPWRSWVVIDSESDEQNVSDKPANPCECHSKRDAVRWAEKQLEAVPA